MKTIREVWTENLRRNIGGRSLKEVSSRADIAYRTLQNMLEGVVPQAETLTKLATYFDVSESSLFVDYDEFETKKPVTPEQALKVLEEYINKPRNEEKPLPSDDLKDRLKAPLRALEASEGAAVALIARLKGLVEICADEDKLGALDRLIKAPNLPRNPVSKHKKTGEPIS